MGERFLATLTSKGQITVPAELRKAWGLKPGDQLAFAPLDEGASVVEPRRRRSVFDRLDELKLPAIARPADRSEVDDAVGEAMREQELRSRGG